MVKLNNKKITSIIGDNMTQSDINGILVFAVIIGGFIVVTIMMQLIGKKFAWHEELE